MTPKSLLRHPMAVSTLKEMTHGHFSPILDDAEAAASAKKVIFCSGKIYYQLIARRQQINADRHRHRPGGTAVPISGKGASAVIGRYKKAKCLDLGAGGAGEHGRLAVHPAEAGRPVEKTAGLMWVETHRPARPRGFPRSTKWSRTALLTGPSVPITRPGGWRDEAGRGSKDDRSGRRRKMDSELKD
jgi:hypothetical protein